MDQLFVLAVALETVGIVGIITGVALELITGQDICFVLITASSAVITAGTIIFSKVMKLRDGK